MDKDEKTEGSEAEKEWQKKRLLILLLCAAMALYLLGSGLWGMLFGGDEEEYEDPPASAYHSMIAAWDDTEDSGRQAAARLCDLCRVIQQAQKQGDSRLEVVYGEEIGRVEGELYHIQ